MTIRQKQEKPLGEDGVRCPAVMLPLLSYKSELLTTKSEAYQHLHLMKATILSKAINRIKLFCLACGSLFCSRIPFRGLVFILVYRLAMDAKTLRGDGVAG